MAKVLDCGWYVIEPRNQIKSRKIQILAIVNQNLQIFIENIWTIIRLFKA